MTHEVISAGEGRTFPKWDTVRAEDGRTHYDVQTEILDEAQRAHSVDRLLQLMRERQEAAIYLSGTRLDNDHGLGSEELGVLLSVMPEDGTKAAVPDCVIASRSRSRSRKAPAITQSGLHPLLTQ